MSTGQKRGGVTIAQKIGRSYYMAEKVRSDYMTKERGGVTIGQKRAKDVTTEEKRGKK